VQICSLQQNQSTVTLTTDIMEVKDSNGNILSDGDSVHVIKDLKVKGMSTTLKRGNVIKGIRLTGSPNEVECRVGKSTVVLKTEFLKKA
jgi:protein PhnA